MARVQAEVVAIDDRVQDQTKSSSIQPYVDYGVVPTVRQDPTRSINWHVTINGNNHIIKKRHYGALVDRGANGGILGKDARILPLQPGEVHRRVDVTGIDNHEMTHLKIVNAASKVQTQRGPVIVILHEYAYHGTGRTIHSAVQLEAFKNTVDDTSIKAGGTQTIQTLDGYVLPLDIIQGLPYLKMQPHTDKEWEELPHVILTSPEQWDPSILDHNHSDHDDWYNMVAHINAKKIITPFDEFGNYRRLEPTNIGTPDIVIEDHEENDQREASFHEIFEMASDLNVIMIFEVDITPSHDDNAELDRNPKKKLQRKPVDYKKYSQYFLGVPLEKIKRTFKATTQHACNVVSGPHIYQTYKSPFPMFNFIRRNEPVATDSIKGQVPAIDCGHEYAQIYVGRISFVFDVFGMSTVAQFVNTFLDCIRKRGVMDKLISDSARVEISNRVKDILRALCIDDWQSEPHYQHQNYAERRWRHLKRNTQWLMNLRNVPPNCWLLCLMYVADVMNHTAEEALGWRPPLEVLTGQTIDISIILCFVFWDVVYVTRYPDQVYHGQLGNEDTDEIRGHFVGFAWNVGHALTFKILADGSDTVINRSRVRLAKSGENNLTLDIKAGNNPEYWYITSTHDDDDHLRTLPTIDLTTIPTEGEKAREAMTDDTSVENKTENSDVPENSDVLENSKNSPPALSNDRTPLYDEVEEAPPLSTITKQKEKTSTVQEQDQDVPVSANTRSKSKRSVGVAEQSRSVPVVEDVNEGDDDDYHSPMMDPPLKDRPLVPDEDVDNEFTPPHLRKNPNTDEGWREEDFVNPEPYKTELPTEPGLPPEELITRTFLMPPRKDGSRERAKIIEIINKHKEGLNENPEVVKFRCLVNGEKEAIVAYNDIVDYIEKDQTWDGIWNFRRIVDWKRVKPGDPEYKGSSINLMPEWEGGERTWEPFSTQNKDGLFDQDPVTVSIYARENNLLKEPVWKKCLPYAKTAQRIIRRANQAKLHSFRTKPIYMYGFQVPRNHEQAMELDRQNGNTKWRDSEIVELSQIQEYKTFIDKGYGYIPGPDYKKIKVHIVYAVKHDGRHKSRLVAGGHLTDTPIDSVYSSVVSLRGIRVLTFIAEQNDMQLWSTDIGNAYLESYTKEKVYIIAGPEFGELEGHTLVIQKALYGLKSSGLRWHQRFAEAIQSEGYRLSKGDNDIWMKDMGDHYEYIAVYVDDLMIVSKNPQAIIDMLQDKFKFKLKGTGPVTFHLGCDFFRDKHGVLCYAPLKYIEKTLDNYKRIFGTHPKQYQSPLNKNDHPELDTSPILEDIDDIKIYQSLIGALQWTIQIGRLDITTAVMTLSRFRAAPRQGHLDRVKRIIGYLSKMRHGAIRIRTEEPDYSDIPDHHYDWNDSYYPDASEEIPDDIPTPKMKPIRITSFFDANLYHDYISGRSVTGILHLFNKTPIDWYSKLQSTVETATFGSEYAAGRTCTEQNIDLRTTLRYLGIPVTQSTMMFGDNETVINTASQPHGKLHKRHNALSYHKVKEAVAAGIVKLVHIAGKFNPADLLSKHWDYPSAWPLLRPLMFWSGDTADIDLHKQEQASQVKPPHDLVEGSDT